jgi:hypothetical protein
MRSGIYKLIFPSGKYYIGKSEDIQARWKQHYASFEKGTHSKRMQEEFNRHGHPEGIVLLECHKDHIDLMESLFIEDNQGPLCLNGNAPKAVGPWEREVLLADVTQLKYSTAVHIKVLGDYQTKIVQLENSVTKVETKLKKLKHKGVQLPEETKSTLEYQEQTIHQLATQVRQAEDTLQQYRNMPLLKRIFSYNVTV